MVGFAGGCAASGARGSGVAVAGTAGASPFMQLSSIPLPTISGALGFTFERVSSQSGPPKNAENPSPSWSLRARSISISLGPMYDRCITAVRTGTDGVRNPNAIASAAMAAPAVATIPR